MDDVMKKRIIGAVVLVLLGISIPVLVSRCVGGGAGGQHGAMRVYEISPDGKAQAVASDGAPNAANADGSPSGAVGDQDNRDGHHSQADSADSSSWSSASATDTESFSTPPVHGDNETGVSSKPPSSAPATQSRTRAEADNRNSGRDRNPAEHSERTAASKPATSAESGGSSAASGWAVQVASFGDADNAKQLAAQLKDRFDKAHYRAGDVKGKTYYRVLIGPYPSEDAARKAAAQLRDQGRKPLVRHLP